MEIHCHFVAATHYKESNVNCNEMSKLYSEFYLQALGIVRGDTHGTCNHLSFEKQHGDCSCHK